MTSFQVKQPLLYQFPSMIHTQKKGSGLLPAPTPTINPWHFTGSSKPLIPIQTHDKSSSDSTCSKNNARHMRSTTFHAPARNDSLVPTSGVDSIVRTGPGVGRAPHPAINAPRVNAWDKTLSMQDDPGMVTKERPTQNPSSRTLIAKAMPILAKPTRKPSMDILQPIFEHKVLNNVQNSTPGSELAVQPGVTPPLEQTMQETHLITPPLESNDCGDFLFNSPMQTCDNNASPTSLSGLAQLLVKKPEEETYLNPNAYMHCLFSGERRSIQLRFCGNRLLPSTMPIAPSPLVVAASHQLSFYFSACNLGTDSYLRSLFDPFDGGVPLRDLAKFQRLCKITGSSEPTPVLVEAIKYTPSLELMDEGKRVRTRTWKTWMPKNPLTKREDIPDA